MSDFWIYTSNLLNTYPIVIHHTGFVCSLTSESLFIAIAKYYLFALLHLPPVISPSYLFGRLSGFKYLEHALSEIPLDLGNDYIVLLGDLNARSLDNVEYIDLLQHCCERTSIHVTTAYTKLIVLRKGIDQQLMCTVIFRV